jgi:DNA-binding transcriptional regulator/RsmH inhibitor MraZ
MIKWIATIDEKALLSLPQEAVDVLNHKVDIEIVGHTLIIRSIEEAERAEEFSQTFQSIHKKRKSAYEQLA